MEQIHLSQPIKKIPPKPRTFNRFANKIVKRYKEKSHISALITINKTFSLQRLMRDYNEIKSQNVPVAGVNAQPLEDNFFEWHGNIKANANNVYRGAVMHLKFLFPGNYPVSPPIIFVMNENLIHQNIIGSQICLDMLNESTDDYKGWRSAYTVLSILIQLQNFFFDIDKSRLTYHEERSISNAILAMNEYNCPKCKHKGSSNPWPEFIKGDQDPAMHRMTKEKYKEAKFKELSCYFRKTSFQEAPLGLGVSILTIPRTGEIRGLVPCMDFLSLKAFSKEKIRKSMTGQRFSHWFPLYFGYEPDKFLLRCTKSLSMICAGNTKQFKQEMILKVMPKFFMTLVNDIISEKLHSSCRALQILLYIYRISAMLVINYPLIRDEIDGYLAKFIGDPTSRHKDITPNLGDLLAMMTLATKHSMEELLPAYIEEQMDRQIFWMIKELPEFENLINKSEIDNIRAKVCFKSGIVGCQILLFYYYFIKKILFRDRKTIEDVCRRLDSNYGSLTDEELETHRCEIEKILKIDSYKEFYKYLHITPPSDQELNAKLKDSFQHSLNKGYHGLDGVRFVPEPKEQARIFMEKLPQITDLLLNKDDFQLIPESDAIWEKLVTEKFDQVVRMRFRYPGTTLTPFNVARHSESTRQEYAFTSEHYENCQKSEILHFFNYYQYRYDNEDDKYLSSLSWRQVYLKLYLELYLKYFQYIADFKALHNLLKIVKDEIIHLNLDVFTVEKIKSNYHYLRMVLSNLVKLKHLTIFFNDVVSVKMIKHLIKGIGNFTIANGEINSLKVFVDRTCTIYSHKDHNILTIIDKMQNLKVLDLSGTAINIDAAVRIRNHLYYVKTIQTLNISDCRLQDPMANEIADGIMKAKCLEKIYIANNLLVDGLTSVLYNLSFQPSIKIVDISNNLNADAEKTGVALYKFIKMSQSIEVLICKDIRELLSHLTIEFFSSLGDNSSLRYLDLSRCGGIKNSASFLGNAIAFNALKNGSLRTLIMRQNFITFPILTTIIEGMKVSEFHHFEWYHSNFNSSIPKESTEYYLQTFHCKLKDLDLGENSFECQFNINDIKQTGKVNHLRTLFENNRELESLNLSKCGMNKHFVDLLVNALHHPNSIRNLNLDNAFTAGEFIKAFMNAFAFTPEKQKDKVLNENMHITSLSLAKNNFGYSGIEAISTMLKDNKTLKILNVYGNLFDVNGARRLKDALEVNQTIEAIDISYNRIKDLGLSSIIKGIMTNENNKIKFIGCRYNFIKNNALCSNLKEILNHQHSHIDTIELANNSFDEKTILSCYNEIHLKAIRKCNIDIFEIVHFLQPEKLERTVWVSPVPMRETKRTIFDSLKKTEAKLFETEKSHLGIPIFLSMKRSRERTRRWVLSTFIEFIHPNSSNRLLQLASTDAFKIRNKKVRVYKAGMKPEKLRIKRRRRFILKKK